MRILIMGLPGSGKTTLASALYELLSPDAYWLNADALRKKYDDWDFSIEGRLRQAKRMREEANTSDKEYVICDFVAPLQKMRDIFDADITVWVDTIEKGRFEDTNKMFEIPTKYDLRVTEQHAEKWANKIYDYAFTILQGH